MRFGKHASLSLSEIMETSLKINQANRTFGQLEKPNANNVAILIGLKFKLKSVNLSLCLQDSGQLKHRLSLQQLHELRTMMWLCNYDHVVDSPDSCVICRGYLHMRTQLVSLDHSSTRSGLDWKQGKFDMQGTSLHCPREGREKEGKGRDGELTKHSARLCSNEQLLRQPINVTLSAFKCEDWTNSALIPAASLPPFLPGILPSERWVGQAERLWALQSASL